MPDAGENVGCTAAVLHVGGVDTAATRKPCVSVTMWRFLPLVFLAVARAHIGLYRWL